MLGAPALFKQGAKQLVSVRPGNVSFAGAIEERPCGRRKRGIAAESEASRSSIAVGVLACAGFEVSPLTRVNDV